MQYNGNNFSSLVSTIYNFLLCCHVFIKNKLTSNCMLSFAFCVASRLFQRDQETEKINAQNIKQTPVLICTTEQGMNIIHIS